MVQSLVPEISDFHIIYNSHFKPTVEGIQTFVVAVVVVVFFQKLYQRLLQGLKGHRSEIMAQSRVGKFGWKVSISL